MENVTIEHQYQLYLQRVGLLPEERLHPEQRKQLRQAFFGAAGQILVLLRETISELPEEQAAEIMQDMLNEILAYFSTYQRQN